MQDGNVILACNWGERNTFEMWKRPARRSAIFRNDSQIITYARNNLQNPYKSLKRALFKMKKSPLLVSFHVRIFYTHVKTDYVFEEMFFL